MPNLEQLSWNQLVEELRELAEHKPSAGDAKDAPERVLHDLLVHQVELEMQNRELRDAQERLEASRARYADLYDFAPVGCLTIGADERIQEINLTGAALLGRDRAEIIGRPFLGVVPLHDRAMVFHEHIRICLEKRCRTDAEIEFVPRGRSPVLLHITSAPVLDASGHATACRTALTDVSDRRRAETAEADARMKEEFLGTVSHELRTPLTAILVWVGLLQERRRRREGVDAEELGQALDVIARNASVQGRLIEDILDVSRILAGKLRVEARPVDLEPVVREAVEALGPAAKAKGIAVSASVAPRTIVSGDAVRLTQVLTNLLNNAVKFTQAGGTIDVAVTIAGERVRIDVRDTGRGIAAQDLPNVFERFMQVDGSTTRSAGGLGLGLAIVDHLVRAHGGDVAASSPGLGLGATFTVRLRRAADVLASAPAFSELRAGEEDTRIDGCRVLCVDDDADALQVMALVLEEHGADVTTAESAVEAVAALGVSVPDVVISDIGLPGEDGYSLMQRIRALPGEASRVQAIALTAYAGPASSSRALEVGFQQFISKPITVDALVRAVATAVRS
jgi:PAS domain S-box-containing protein